jgi:heptosyltransferase-1
MDYAASGEKMNPARDLDPRSILIIKLSAIGDVVQTLPMVEALKKQYPLAKIDWLVEEDAADLLTSYPVLSRVIVSHRKDWQKRLRRQGELTAVLKDIWRFIRELRKVQYDWVIDNHGLFKSGLFVLLSRGKRKIGFKPSPGIADEGNYLFTHERYPSLPIERHALERYLNLATQLGVSVDKPFLKYIVPLDSVEKAKNLLMRNDFFWHPLIAIHPMAKWTTKQWPWKNFIRLISALGQKGVSVILTGSGQDRETLKEIQSQAQFPQKVLNLAGQTGLRELAGLFSLADLVLTTDTGPMHIAAAVQASLIALFGPTAPWRTGPYGNGHVILRKSLSCSPCFKKKCSTMECMNSLSVEEVLEAVEIKLKGVEGSRIQGVK